MLTLLDLVLLPLLLGAGLATAAVEVRGARAGGSQTVWTSDRRPRLQLRVTTATVDVPAALLCAPPS